MLGVIQAGPGNFVSLVAAPARGFFGFRKALKNLAFGFGLGQVLVNLGGAEAQGNLTQDLQMLDAVAHDEDKDANRPVVGRSVLDALAAHAEDDTRRREPGYDGMGNRDAVSDPGRNDLFPFHDFPKEFFAVESRSRVAGTEKPRHFSESVGLVSSFEKEDRFFRKIILDRQERLPSLFYFINNPIPLSRKKELFRSLSFRPGFRRCTGKNHFLCRRRG